MTLITSRPRRRVAAIAPLLAALALTASARNLRADVTAEGDVSSIGVAGIPIEVEDGGVIEGDIIVGGTGLAGVTIPIGRLIIDNPAFTLPLVSDNGYIGGAPGPPTGQGDDLISSDSLGLVSVSGFFSQWNIEEILSVGGFGEAYLEITGGGLVSTVDETGLSTVDEDAFVGHDLGSQGFVTITGFGSRMTNEHLIVGREGFGRIDVSARGRLETISGAVLGDERTSAAQNILGVGHVTVDGLGTRWNVGDDDGVGGRDDLVIGREGTGTVEVRNQAVVRVDDDTSVAELVGSFGEIIVNGRGSLFWTYDQLQVAINNISLAEIHVENEGTLRADELMNFGLNSIVDLTAGGVLLSPTITNNGVIRGDGRLDTGLTGIVTNTGDIRNAAGIANTRERLVVTGPLTNLDNIESVGGEMEFQSLVTNDAANGDIVGINAIFRFSGGLNNNGRLFLKDSLIYTLGVQSSAAMLVFEGESVLEGNLTLTASNDFLVEVGHTSSLLSVDGNVTLAGNLVVTAVDDVLGEGSGDGYAPGVGDTFEILTGNNVVGTFADVDDFFSTVDFQAIYEPGRVLLTVIGGASPFDADFNGNGTVDGFDFITWQSNYGGIVAPGTNGDADGDGNVDDTDYQIWKNQFGGPPALAVAAAVPEPTAALLALMALIPLARRRR